MTKVIKRETYWIYILTDPRTHQVKYVGCTHDPDRRHKQHIKLHGTLHPSHARGLWLQELQQESLTPSLTVIDKCSYKDRRSTELKWITHFLALGADLTNTNGNPNIPSPHRPHIKTRDKRLPHPTGDTPCTPRQ